MAEAPHPAPASDSLQAPDPVATGSAPRTDPVPETAPAGSAPRPHPALDELIATLERLRAPGGCAWDREQTHASLVQYLLEEAYELAEAIETGTREELIEELGDVLYQVVFHSDIAAHTPGEGFTIDDVAARTTAKMVGRHPHVFGDRRADTAADVVDLWDDVKAAEKPARTSVLDGVPLAMPSLLLAQKLLGRAEKAGAGVPRTDADDPAVDAEELLGRRILALAAAGRADGLDAERGLRTALRALTRGIRQQEAAAQRVQAREV